MLTRRQGTVQTALITGLTSFGLVGLLLPSARATELTLGQPPAAPPQMMPSLVAQTEPTPAQSTVEMSTYSQRRAFAIDYPQDWQVEEAGDRHILIYSGAPSATPDAQAVKTEVWLVSEETSVVFNQAIEQIKTSGTQMLYYDATTIEDRTAVQLWLGGYDPNFPNTLATYIGYGTYGTAIILSHYTASDDPATEDLLVQMHNSFKLVF